MRNKHLWLMVVICTSLSFVAGWTLAQEKRRYPYLPEKYSQQYPLTYGEWQLMWLNMAFQKGPMPVPVIDIDVKWCQAMDDAHKDCLTVFASGCLAPHTREHLLKGGETGPLVQIAYENAAQALVSHVREYFPEILSENIEIVMIAEKLTWTWRDGKLTWEEQD